MTLEATFCEALKPIMAREDQVRTMSDKSPRLMMRAPDCSHGSSLIHCQTQVLARVDIRGPGVAWGTGGRPLSHNGSPQNSL
ncbi:hypothetical protein CDAR_186151 [Caerostris darwini]|uniref:Uncharacterized protein n=1 Tax=Caerostris darwini TaxID=1538125 RepID=A0AAV4WDD8_9ARAC|nr:hypothetical protein CDAR_186151 [Caerostris darwini]